MQFPQPDRSPLGGRRGADVGEREENLEITFGYHKKREEGKAAFYSREEIGKMKNNCRQKASPKKAAGGGGGRHHREGSP